MTFIQLPSPIGTLTLRSDGNALTGLWLEDQRFAPEHAGGNGTDPILEQAKIWLECYFDGKRPDPRELPLRPHGTPFQQKVWDALLAIPYGSTITYGQLAGLLGCGSPQAIGQAVGKNPISIVIPCHRVVAENGPGGYAGGLERKLFLLELEK